MAETNLSCSVTQGFNFQKDSQEAVGHINSLKLSEKDLKSDFNVTDPEEAEKGTLVPVFGIVSSIYWEGGYGDPVQFNCQVSTPNKNVLAALQHTTMKSTDVECEFTIYDFDPEAKTYYKCFHCGGEKLKALVLKSGGALAMQMDMDQSDEVPSPKNYSFSLGVMPKDLNMAVQLAISSKDKFAKKWGIEVSK